MKRDKDKELDDLFKNGLGEPPHQAAYQEGDWDAMEQMLDGPKKNRVIAFWLPILSAAALLLVALGGWWLFAPVDKATQNTQMAVATKIQPMDTLMPEKTVTEQPQIATVPQPTKNSSGNGDVTHNGGHGQSGNQLAVNKNNLSNADATHKGNKAQPANQLAGAKNIAPKIKNQAVTASNILVQPANQIVVSKNNLSNADNTATGTNNASNQAITSGAQTAIAGGASPNAIVANNTPANNTAVIKPVMSEMDSIIKANAGNDAIAAVKPKITKTGDSKVQFGLSLIGAPEINAVGSFSDSKRGTSVGLLFSAGYKKFTLSTGATYAKKPYGSTYDVNSTQYTVRGYIDGIADCRVLDIPINLDFQLYNKKQNKFSVGTGISSYIMLHESYSYNYVDPNIDPSTYTVPGMHKYMFSILNLQATYTRQLNSKIGLSFQPYMKLPLAEIGNSKAKLQSAGFAVGVNWSLSPGKKR